MNNENIGVTSNYFDKTVLVMSLAVLLISLSMVSPFQFSWDLVMNVWISAAQNAWWKYLMLVIGLLASTAFLAKKYPRIARYMGSITVFALLYPSITLLHGFSALVQEANPSVMPVLALSSIITLTSLSSLLGGFLS